MLRFTCKKNKKNNYLYKIEIIVIYQLMFFLASARRARMEQSIFEVWGILSTSEGETSRLDTSYEK